MIFTETVTRSFYNVDLLLCVKHFIFFPVEFVFLYPDIFRLKTNVILTFLMCFNVTPGKRSLIRDILTLYANLCVLFQYSILCNIVSKTNESLIYYTIS